MLHQNGSKDKEESGFLRQSYLKDIYSPNEWADSGDSKSIKISSTYLL